MIHSSDKFYMFFFQTYTIEIVLLVQEFLQGQILSLQSYKESADSFMCTLIPESPPSSSPHIEYTPGGLIYKPGGSNMQHVTAISFLLLAYAKYLSETSQTVNCGSMTVGPESLRLQAKKQVSLSYTLFLVFGNLPKSLIWMELHFRIC